MALDITKTYSLLMAVKQMLPPVTFLRDTYFPTNDSTDIFSTEYVLVEYKDGRKKLAPFVAPRKGGVTVLREGSNMQSYEPPYIAPKRVMTIDELKKRGFGEAILTELTPAQREAQLALADMQEMSEMIARREEAMAAETMLNNSCVMNHIADDGTVKFSAEIKFYSETTNPAKYTPSVTWDAASHDILGDLYAMAMKLKERGLAATDFICAPDVARLILNDEDVYKLLDNRRYEMGNVTPRELPSGVTLTAVLNVYGIAINILTYAETYEADDGTATQFIPAGYGIMTAPRAGRTLYGAVTQMEQADNNYHTYAARRVPKYLADAKDDVREIYLKSRPLLIPNQKNPWISGKFTA